MDAENKLKKKRDAYRRDKYKNLPRKTLDKTRFRAKRLGLEFNLTLEDFITPESCEVPGCGRQIVSGNKIHKGSPNIDRIDNSKGYIKGNVKIICQRCNRLKSDSTLEEIRNIYLYYLKNTDPEQISPLDKYIFIRLKEYLHF